MKPRGLRLLVMHVSTRCDQACAHCSIWKSNGKGGDPLGVDERLALLGEAKSLGARSVLFTGGEPLLCDHIESLARGAHLLGLSVQIASNGLGLGGARAWLGQAVDEVYLSVEGPEAIHDSIRGASMFARLRASIAAVRDLAGRPRLVGRSVISSRNAAVLEATVAAARELGLDAISFLSVDVLSEAFGGEPSARLPLRPGPAEVAAMREAIARLDAAGELGRFVSEDASKLARMAAEFAKGDARRTAPACNAPEWSSVVEADGALRPCFFQPKASRVGRGLSLSVARDSAAYADALRSLGQGNPVCAACVCPKQIGEGVQGVKERVKTALGRVLAAPGRRTGVSA